jgi:hypothetical protein
VGPSLVGALGGALGGTDLVGGTDADTGVDVGVGVAVGLDRGGDGDAVVEDDWWGVIAKTLPPDPLPPETTTRG